MSDKAFEERVLTFMPSNIPADADMAILKAKCAEVAEKTVKLTIEYLKQRTELSKEKRRLAFAERTEMVKINQQAMTQRSTQRLDKEGRKLYAEQVINGREETKGIYEKIGILEEKVTALETIRRDNKIVADRLNDMVVIESTMTKMKQTR